MTGARSAAWRVVGCSVRGAAHRRRGVPSQDAVAWRRLGAEDAPVALALADGHGSAASFRSGTGATLAVETAVGLLAEFVDERRGEDAPREAAGALAHELVARWKTAVERHAGCVPMPPRRNGPLHLAYGSTVLAAAACEAWLLLLQLGDGDMLLVPASGEARRAWPRDERFLGGETASLCSPDAVLQVRVGVHPLRAGEPLLALLSTDGYSNSFRDDAGFRKTGRDLFEIVEQDGFGRVEEEIADWLEEASELGSGDDVTAGVLWRAPGEAPGDGS